MITGVITANAQALIVTPNANAGANFDINAQTRIYYKGSADGLNVRTDNSTTVLNSTSDLIWLCLNQAQPNNPKIFGMTSFSAAISWDECFTVRANGNVGIFNEFPSAALEVGSGGSIRQVKVNGNIVFGSDARMKENIRDISNSLTKLKQLRSVSYNFKEDEKEQPIPEKFLENGVDVEKMEAELKSIPKTNQDLLSRNFYGFLAQDVQKLFPDLVFTDSAGMLSVDYIGIIPLLVDGLKEQQSQIEELRSEIEILKANSSADELFRSAANVTGTTGISNPLLAQCKLHQNAPNPFKERTEIRYYLPQEVQSAEIYIFNLQGNLLKKIPAPHSGLVEIKGSNFHAGMYIYTLVADGQAVDTKRMILTK